MTTHDVRRYLWLDSVRGLLAVMVVLYHVARGERSGLGELPEAVVITFDLAVAGFFALSGFVLYKAWTDAVAERRDLPSVRSYAVRRAARILPLYYVLFILVWTSRYAGVPGQWRDFWYHLTFTQIYDTDFIFWTLGPAWSLAVEVHFYLLLPLVAIPAARWAARRGGRSAAWAMAVPGLLLIGTSVLFKLLAVTVFDVAGNEWAVWFSFPAMLDQFGCGMLLAVAATWGAKRFEWDLVLRGLVGGAGGALVVAASFLQRADSMASRAGMGVAGVGFTLLVAAVLFGPSRGHAIRALETRPLVVLGTVSYSIYLVHEPILRWLFGKEWFASMVQEGTLEWFAAAAIAVALVVAVSWVLWTVVEAPFQRLGRVLTPQGRVRHFYRPERYRATT